MEEMLIEAALKAQEHAYAPYSKFCVGAALLTTEGKIFHGCNVENSSFGATVCAERTAALKAVSEGFREFSAIAIVSSSGGFTFPCGICRQFLAEFMKPEGKVILYDNIHGKRIYTLEELIPEVFHL